MKTKSVILVAMILTSLLSQISSSTTQSGFEQQELISLKLTVWTDKLCYFLGDLVILGGTVSSELEDPIESVAVAIEVKDPRSNTAFLDIVYSEADGSYIDSFRLPDNAPLGKYKVYVTASKTGYEPASNQTEFYVTSIELGETIVSVAGHKVSLQEGDTVTATFNATMVSKSLTSAVFSMRLVMASPKGQIIYDNFNGIGTEVDYKLTTVYNYSVSTINIEFVLQSPIVGYYSYFFGIYSADTQILYDSTLWTTAFLYTQPPLTTINLGTINPESTISTDTNIHTNRFDSIQINFNLFSPLQTLTIKLDITEESRFDASLKTQAVEAKKTFYRTNEWILYNLPADEYTLILTTISNKATLNKVTVESGYELTSPSIKIVSAEATSQTATPNGKISYHIYVKWNITTPDTITILAKLEGTLQDEATYSIQPLYSNQRDFYLTVTAPSQPDYYTVEINTTLNEAKIYTTTEVQLEVRYGDYNITIAPEVKYYKMPPWWQVWNRNPIYVDDPNELSALDITNIKIETIDEFDGSGNPKFATISFQAYNKLSGEILENLKFGEGVHYEIHIKFDSKEYQLATILAGDTKTVFAHHIPITNNQISFTIIYRIWWLGEVFEIAAGALKPAVSMLLEGIDLGLANLAIDLAKVVSLYLLQIWIEQENGYMVRDDVIKFLTELGITITTDLIYFIDDALDVTRNSFFALLGALTYSRMTGKIDFAKWIYAIFKLIIHVSGNALPRIVDTLQQAAVLAFKKIGITLTENINQYTDAKWFLKKIGFIISITELAFTIARLMGAPREEGKIVEEAGIGQQPAITVDPEIMLNFNGPIENSSLNYFVSSDISKMKININKTQAEIRVKVNENVTANFLEVLSDQIIIRNMLSIFGFNSTHYMVVFENTTSTFTILSNGTTYQGLIKAQLEINSTWIKGQQIMSVEAIRTNSVFWLNGTLTYPFSKNLTYTISINLPEGSQILQVLSDKNCIIENTTIIWNKPVNWLAIEFIPPETDIAITNISLSNPNPVVNETVTIFVTVTNFGNVTKTFDISVNYTRLRDPLIGTQTITLAPGETKIVNFTWTPQFSGRYQIKAYTSVIPEDPDLNNNSMEIIIHVRSQITIGGASGTEFLKCLLK